MSIVKIKAKSQVTLPNTLLKQVGLKVGDFLEAKEVKGNIILTPQSFIDLRLAKSLEDVKAGRTHGPFATADEAIKFLTKSAKAAKKAKKTSKR